MPHQVKNLPAMQEMQDTWIWSLGQEDPLEEEMATHFSILAGKIPRTQESGGLQSKGLQRVEHDWAHKHTHRHTHTDTHTQTHTHTDTRFLSFPHSAVVNNLWPMQETPDTGSISASGRSPGVGNRTHSSMLAWKVPRTEEPGGLHGVTKSQTGMSTQHICTIIFVGVPDLK